MIEMKRIEDITKESRLPQHDLTATAYCAFDGDILLGYCLFCLETEDIRILDLATDPKDFGIADGLARASAFFAEQAGMTKILIAGNNEELLVFEAVTGIFRNREATIEALFGTSSCQTEAGGGCSGCSMAGNCSKSDETLGYGG